MYYNKHSRVLYEAHIAQESYHPYACEINGEEWMMIPIPRNSDLDAVLDALQAHNITVIGGFARWLASPGHLINGEWVDPQPAVDIDVFLPSNDDNIFADCREALSQLYGFERESAMSVYFWNTDKDRLQTPTNLIKPRRTNDMLTFGHPEEIVKYFDFTIVRAFITPDRGWVVVDPDYLADEVRRRLCWRHINCPIAAAYRWVKYAKKGYWATMPEVLKIFADWDGRPETYRERLFTLLGRDDITEDELAELELLLHVD